MKKGQKFNRLTAVRFDHKDKYYHLYWLFRCDCGKEKVIIASSVRRNITKSCGCLHKEKITTHGMYYSSEHSIWAGMKTRCLNKNDKGYKNYGDRGIKICSRWMKFENFYADMGKRPKDKTLDRIDNDGNYEPDNCRWATLKEQHNNTRSNHLLTFKGQTKTLTQWADEIGIKYNVIRDRINSYGWSVEKALTTPVRSKII